MKLTINFHEDTFVVDLIDPTMTSVYNAVYALTDVLHHEQRIRVDGRRLCNDDIKNDELTVKVEATVPSFGDGVYVDCYLNRGIAAFYHCACGCENIEKAEHGTVDVLTARTCKCGRPMKFHSAIMKWCKVKVNDDVVLSAGDWVGTFKAEHYRGKENLKLEIVGHVEPRKVMVECENFSQFD